MNIFNINLFQFKTKPEGKERASEFLNEGYICIGWSKVADMTSMSKEDIREALASEYDYSGRSLSTNLGTVNTFRNIMREGDVVLITQDGFVHVGIIGEYEYHPDKVTDGSCHRRSCDWKKMIKKEELKEDVRSLLRNMTTVTKYPHPFVTSGIGEILGFISANDLPFEHTDPHIIIEEVSDQEPTDNKDKNQEKLLSRLETLGATALEILEEEMKSDDHDRRRKAAVEILSILKHTSQKTSNEE